MDMGNRLPWWRVLLAAGLVFVLLGLLMNGNAGAEALLIGLVCLVAGAVMGLLRRRA